MKKVPQKIKTFDRINRSEVTKKIAAFFSKYNDALTVFLFGSFAGGDVTPFSDLDIAIIFDDNYDFYKINDIKEKLSDILGLTVDIVNLNRASSIIKMQVLKKGILLLNKSPRVYHEFFVHTVKEYDDLKRTRREIEENILRGRIYA